MFSLYFSMFFLDFCCCFVTVVSSVCRPTFTLTILHPQHRECRQCVDPVISVALHRKWMIDDMSTAADYLPLTDVDVATTTIIKTKKKIQKKTKKISRCSYHANY